MVYAGDVLPTQRQLSVYPRAEIGCGTLHEASEIHECVDPLTYPLLFPRGELGWSPQLHTNPAHTPKDRKRRKLDILDFGTS